MARSNRGGGTTADRPMGIVRYLPLGYFGVCLALVATILPTALRPPQDDPTTTSEFSPDAPPEEDAESILGDLAQGRSGTAGAGGGEGDEGESVGDVEDASQPPEQRRARNCPFGVGDPPRQTESIYSGPCAPAWQGDNGGSTYKNVSENEVRLGFYHSTDGCEGPAPTEPSDDESSGDRTMRVLQTYVNQAFETYGRQVRLYCVPDGTKDDAVLAAEEWKVFASASIAFEYCREMVRRDLPVFCDPPVREEMLESRPYLWSWQMDRTSMQELGAEYYCKKLLGKPARFAGESSGYRSTERKLGIVTEQTPVTGLTTEPMIPELRRRCGAEAEHIVYTSDTAADQVATAISKFKVEGVTTVVQNTKFTNSLLTFQAADSAAYFPEWPIFSPYGLDINIIGNLMPQSQMTQVFGLSGWEWPRPTPETECYRAYKSIDPNNDPNGSTCFAHFPPLIQFMNGIQAAGPHLTPETFRDGLFDIGYRFYQDIPWAIGGGYSAADYTYIDNVGEIWWDPSATKPEDGSPGAYRWVRCGERYRADNLPREDPLVFQDGAPGPGRDGCPS